MLPTGVLPTGVLDMPQCNQFLLAGRICHSPKICLKAINSSSRGEHVATPKYAPVHSTSPGGTDMPQPQDMLQCNEFLLARPICHNPTICLSVLSWRGRYATAPKYAPVQSISPGGADMPQPQDGSQSFPYCPPVPGNKRLGIAIFVIYCRLYQEGLVQRSITSCRIREMSRLYTC